MSNQPPMDDSSLRLSNINARLTRIGSSSDFRIQAIVINPNTFPVYDILARCDFTDRRGNPVASARVRIVDAVRPAASRYIARLDLPDWPERAWLARCMSVKGETLA